MKLSDYLKENRISVHQFAQTISVASRMTVHRYIKGERIPKPVIMKRITEKTKGAVTFNDFPTYKKTSIKKIQKFKTTKTILPYKKSFDFSLLYDFYQNSIKIESEKLNLSESTILALQELGNRAAYKKKCFYLDGRLTCIKEIIVLANELRQRRGLCKIFYPGL